jgi:hypothetical protein
MNELTDAPELPPLPANSAVLAVRPGPDRVHTILRLQFDVTHLSDDRQKLLLHLLSQGLTQFEKSVKEMDRITVAARLAKLERVKAVKGNGQ